MNDNLKKTLENLPPDKLDALLSAVEKSTGKSKKEITNAANDQSGEMLSQMLGKIDKKKLDNLLSDRQALDKLLSTPQAKALLQSILGKQ